MTVDTARSARGQPANDDRPTLVFVWDAQSGPSRRMDSLIAWIRVTRKRRLRVVDVEAGRNPAVVDKLRIGTVPALVLLRDHKVVARLEGKATGDEIEALIEPHLGGASDIGEPEDEA